MVQPEFCKKKEIQRELIPLNVVEKAQELSLNCKKDTVTQFSMEDDVEQAATRERIVELLNEAFISKQSTMKNLRIIQELIVYQEPNLLNSFLNDVVGFQNSRKAEVRKFVVVFIELACKADLNILPKVIENLIILLDDPIFSVQKQVVQTSTQLYKIALQWLCSAKSTCQVMEKTWASITQLKFLISNMLESENDGLRTQIIKFMETVIIAQTFRSKYCLVKEGDLSLGDIPAILTFFQPRKMEDEAWNFFEQLVAFHGAPYISGYNLMTCVMALSTIAKKRFEFFPKVLQAFNSLHVNLPPTLGQSQLNSVKKTLKFELISLSKHQAAKKFYQQISTMLSKLGAAPQQIAKCFPMIDPVHKWQTPEDRNGIKESRYENKLASDAQHISKPKLSKLESCKNTTAIDTTAIDTTAENLYSRLSEANASDLVLASLLNLPDTMPVQFQFTYTPIAAPGTVSQIQHVARLLARQLTLAHLERKVKGTNAISKTQENIVENREENVHSISEGLKRRKPLALNAVGSKISSYSKYVSHSEIKTPNLDETGNDLSRLVYEQILNAEKCSLDQGVSAVRSRILVKLATQFGGNYRMLLKKHIAEDLPNRMDLLLTWLFEEYVTHKGYNGSPATSITNYEETVSSFLAIIPGNKEEKHALFSRFFMESPHITVSMLDALKTYCIDEHTVKEGLQIIKVMIRLRAPMQLDFLGVVLNLTLCEKLEVRSRAVDYAIKLYSMATLEPHIETFALQSLKVLLKGNPPNFFPANETLTWNEDRVKTCLHLFLSLLPMNHHLIHSLGSVYVQSTTDVKRIILQSLEVFVHRISINSPELFLFIDSCPKGSETLVTRIIHLLTKEVSPSLELVSHVKNFYQKRLPDVRILIPIIGGLTKNEIVSILPELIKLNPIIVKEVFHRLLTTKISSPLKPAELLIALHNVDSSKCNLKSIIQATSFCFEERRAYTQVVLAVVIQQLIEQNPLPLLLMRTIILSLTNYPDLLDFVTNILKRLVEKEVWKEKKMWEGFIKCCLKTKPQSFQVLLQLPSEQLEQVFQTYPDLQHAVYQHICGIANRNKKVHVSEGIMDILDTLSHKCS